MCKSQPGERKAGTLAPLLDFTEDDKPKCITSTLSGNRRGKKRPRQYQTQVTMGIADDCDASFEEEASPATALQPGVVNSALREAGARDTSSASDSESDPQEVLHSTRPTFPTREAITQQVDGHKLVPHEAHMSIDDDEQPPMMNVDDHIGMTSHASDYARSRQEYHQEEEEDDNDNDDKNSAECGRAHIRTN
ncbi:hypothetical protein N0V82_000575 [Gnomoniopsis sp. IMI 355080]|nr:hypothetical protein N0V82_000575 [Gnomoniopsis sp. IMI 355080]